MQEEFSNMKIQKRKKESAFIMRKQTKLVAVLSAAALLAIGASMTSFAAGWTQEDGTWVYLDRDGDRVTEDWKKSGANYYWLDEDGQMATDLLVEDDDDHYYVDANGVRVANQWVSVENEDDEDVNGEAVDTLWYYMGSSGKAYKATGTTYKNSTINGKKYFFDGDGHMLSGWLEDGNDLYYLGSENEGWAYTEWQYLELDDDIEADYDNNEAWFYFQSSGKAHKNKRKYINGKYYAFDENGVMITDWQEATPEGADVSTPSSIDLQDGQRSFYDVEDGDQASGWIKTFADREESGDEKWFYLVAGEKNRVFNANGQDGKGSKIQKYTDGNNKDGDPKTDVAARIIKGKTYLFDNKGQMLTGVFKFETEVKRGNSSKLEAGVYYFNKNGGSVEGQMETGKATITYDGDSYSYYFKDNGSAYTNVIKNNSAYDGLGVCLDASDGNANAVKNINEINGACLTIDGKTYTDGTIIVSSSGRVKKSGTVTIDGVKYEVSNYLVTTAYDKDDKDKNDDKSLYHPAK